MVDIMNIEMLKDINVLLLIIQMTQERKEYIHMQESQKLGQTQETMILKKKDI